MSQPDMPGNYGYSLDTTNMWNLYSESLRVGGSEDLGTNPSFEVMRSNPAGDNDDGDDGLEDLGTDPSAEGTEPTPAADDNNDDDGQYRGKKAIRHTEHQVQALQAFFKKHPMPNRKQREEVARVTGLTQLQVKFWCQNKRSSLKGQHKTQEVTRLKSEVKNLRAENAKYKKALRAACLNCGRKMTLSERQLMVENAYLRDEMGKILAIASRHVNMPSTSAYPHLSSSSYAPCQFQTQSNPIRPALMLAERGGMHHPEWNYLINEPTVVAGQSNPGVPAYNPRDVCDLTLMTADPQDGTS